MQALWLSIAAARSLLSACSSLPHMPRLRHAWHAMKLRCGDRPSPIGGSFARTTLESGLQVSGSDCRAAPRFDGRLVSRLSDRSCDVVRGRAQAPLRREQTATLLRGRLSLDLLLFHRSFDPTWNPRLLTMSHQATSDLEKNETRHYEGANVSRTITPGG